MDTMTLETYPTWAPRQVPMRAHHRRPAARWAVRLLVGAAFLVAMVALSAVRSQAAVTCTFDPNSNAGLSTSQHIGLMTVVVDDTSSGGAQSVLIASSGVSVTVNGSACSGATLSKTNEVDVFASPTATLAESTTIDLGNSDFVSGPTAFFVEPSVTASATNSLTIQNGTNVVLGNIKNSNCLIPTPCYGAVLGNEQNAAVVQFTDIGKVSVAGGSASGTKNVLSAAGKNIPTAACQNGFTFCTGAAVTGTFNNPFGAGIANPPTLDLCGGSVANLFVPGASSGETINTCGGGTATSNIVDVSTVGVTATVDLNIPALTYGQGASQVTDTMSAIQNVNGSSTGGRIIGNSATSIFTGGNGTTFVLRGGSTTITGQGTALNNVVDFSDPANAAVAVDLNAGSYSAGSAHGSITGVGTVIGSKVGGDTFTPLFSTASTYSNPSSNLNTISVAAAPSACTIDLTVDTLTCNALNDSFANIQNVQGSNLGGTIVGNGSPSNLAAGNAGITSFILTGGADTIQGSATAINYVSFQNSTSAVSINLNNGSYSGFNSGTMSHIQAVTGSVNGGDSFTPNFTSGGVTYIGFATANHNRIDLSSGTCAATVNLSTATETVTGCGSSDTLFNVQDILGVASGPAASTASFNLVNASVNINLNNASYTYVTSSVSGVLTNVNLVKGSKLGGDVFTPNLTSGGSQYTGFPGTSNTVNLAGVACSPVIDVTTSPETISGCGATDLATGLQNIIGTPASTTVAFSNAGGPVTVNLSGVTDTASGVGPNSYLVSGLGGFSGSITGVQNVNGSSQGDRIIGNNNPSTFNGGNGPTTFVVNGGLDTIHGAPGFNNVVDFSNSNTGVLVNLNTGVYSGFSSGSMTNIQTVKGSSLGGDTFIPNFTAGGSSYIGASGTHNKIDVSAGNCAATVALSSSTTEIVTGCGAPDSLVNIQDVVGVSGGSSITTVSFALVATPVTINLNNATYSYGSVSGNFTNISKVSGSMNGADTFTPNLTTGGSQFVGTGTNNTLNLQGAACSATVDVTTSPQTITGCGSTDLATGLANISGPASTTIAFSNAVGAVTVNLSGATDGVSGVGPNSYRITGGITGTISGPQNVIGSSQGDRIIGNNNPSTFTGGNKATTFVVTGGLDTIHGAPGFANVVDFSNAPAGVTINLNTGTYSGFSSGTLTNIQVVIGSGNGGDTFTPSTSGGNTYNGSAAGQHNRIDLSSSPCSATVDLNAGTVAGCGSPDTIINIQDVVGVASGPNVTILTFVHSDVAVTVNLNIGTYTYAGSTTPAGSLNGITRVVGSLVGGDTYVPNFSSGNDSFSGHAGTVNTVDLSSGPCAATVDVSANPETVTGCGSVDTLSNTQNVIGVSGGVDITTVTFSHATGGVVINLNPGGGYSGPGLAGTFTGINKVVGSPTGGDRFTPNFSIGGSSYSGTGRNALDLTGSTGCLVDIAATPETITGCGTTQDQVTGLQDVTGNASTTVSFASASSGVVVSLPAGTYRIGAGTLFNLVGVQNIIGSSHGDTIIGNTQPSTFTGGSGATTFKLNGGNDTIQGSPGAVNTVDFTASGGGVTINLSTGTYTGFGSGTLTNVSVVKGSGGGGDTFTPSFSATSPSQFLGSGAGSTLDVRNSGCASTVVDLRPETAASPAPGTVTCSSSGTTFASFTDIQNVFGSNSGGTLFGNANPSVLQGGTANTTFVFADTSGASTIAGAAGVVNTLDVHGTTCPTTITLTGNGGAETLVCNGIASSLTNIQNVVGSSGSNATTVAFGSGPVAASLTSTGFTYSLGTQSGSLTAVATLDAAPGAANSLNVATASCPASLDLSFPGLETLTGCGVADTLSNFRNITGIGSGSNATSVTFASSSGVTLTVGSGSDTYVTSALSGTLTTINKVAGSAAIGPFNNLILAGPCPATLDLSGQANETLTGCGLPVSLSGFENVTGIPTGVNATSVTFASSAQGVNLVITSATAATYANGQESGTLLGVTRITGSGAGGNGVDLSSCPATIDLSNQALETVTGCGGTDTLGQFQNVTGAASGPDRTTVSFATAGHGVTVNLNFGTYTNGSQTGQLTSVTSVRGSNTGGDTYTPDLAAGGDTFVGTLAATHNRIDLSASSCANTVDLVSGTVTGCFAPDTFTNVQDVTGNPGFTTVSFAHATNPVSINLDAGSYNNGSKSGVLSGVFMAVGSSTGGDTFTPSFVAGTTSSYSGSAGGVNSIDLSHAPAGATINLNRATGSVSIAVVGASATVNLTGVERVVGTTHGDAFTPVFGPVADTYVGSVNAGVTNVLDLTSSTAGSAINLATGAVAGEWGATDTVSGITRVLGGAFNESLVPGPGNITFDGGGGSNTIDFSPAPAGVTVNLASGTTSGGWGGTDTLVNVENAIGTAFDDTLVGGPRPGVLAGLAGNDTFTPAGVDTVVDGGTGVNTLDLSGLPAGVNIDLSDPSPQSLGATGTIVLVPGTIQVLKGPNPASHLSAGSGTAILTGGNNGGNVLTGGSGNDTLNAGSGGDLLQAGGGNDVLNGGSGNDTLVAGPGNDIFNGGGGNNTLDFSHAPAGVQVNLSNSFYTSPSGVLPGNSITGGWGASDTMSGIQNIVGTPFNDVLVGDGGPNVLNGLGGSDYLVGGGGGDTLISGAGNSTFVPGSGNNLIQGGPGNNTVDYSADPSGVNVNLLAGIASNGYGGQDTLSGIRNIVGSNFNDVLRLGAQAGTITSNGGNDLLVASPAGGSTLIAGSGNDTLQAGAGGGDTLVAGSGMDVFFTRNGKPDTIVGGKPGDQAQIDPGMDSVSSSVQLLP